MRGGLKRGEGIHILPSSGKPHLCVDGYLAVFKTMGAAEKAAQRTGGQAYRSRVTRAFLVKYESVEQ
ncbi:hypothetical protein BcepSauron_155 [Burkholderia phage BcepSauron]|uniref:Uncharacterized protein n=2 Tax=Sarumanvirus TaxID=2843450 RepID=A0A482MLM6_9CAUD|nr:hypothetical protein H1O16_gp155 [Burkholderia phage BcepSaruman]YP_009904533.1 hypothetical protein H1O17_gp155 [Burkholderia phage BcepSauron]QBQ74535.1 hypothetical protein BcepSauron_155 [Burkholderia phage BcepSauron]QBX06568.1 hypothetical protein BcepSaruman_155 [Burkholderia phage BcepSaruman]